MPKRKDFEREYQTPGYIADKIAFIRNFLIIPPEIIPFSYGHYRELLRSPADIVIWTRLLYQSQDNKWRDDISPAGQLLAITYLDGGNIFCLETGFNASNQVEISSIVVNAISDNEPGACLGYTYTRYHFLQRSSTIGPGKNPELSHQKRIAIGFWNERDLPEYIDMQKTAAAFIEQICGYINNPESMIPGNLRPQLIPGTFKIHL